MDEKCIYYTKGCEVLDDKFCERICSHREYKPEPQNASELSTEVLDLEKRYGDQEENILSIERALLQKVFEASSDLVQGYYNRAFCNAVGGLQKLKSVHELATKNYLRWLDENEGD